MTEKFFLTPPILYLSMKIRIRGKKKNLLEEKENAIRPIPGDNIVNIPGIFKI